MSLSYLSQRNVIGFFLVLILCVGCKKDYDSTNPLIGENLATSGPSQTLSQTKTANLFNCWGEGVLDLWSQKGEGYIAANDGSYAYSKKLSANGPLQLQLHDFRFSIPAGATIESIIVTARRFKSGKGSIKDHLAYLITKRPEGGFLANGPILADPNSYPNTETAVTYSQNGAGTNGGFATAPHPYQWTPEMINELEFGVRIYTLAPVGGAVVVYYDQVTITVNYTAPATL
jgi:hypothetical protein